jgi:hypothetical protein
MNEEYFKKMSANDLLIVMKKSVKEFLIGPHPGKPEDKRSGIEMIQRIIAGKRSSRPLRNSL